MSKLIMTTAEKILAKALEMFNEKGIEYVGLRELAAVLNIRVGNITYYFPTKDDLVNALSLALNKLNSEVVVANEEMTVAAFLNMLKQVFHHHVQYRCLLLSFVHLIEQNKVISERYKQTASDRNSAIESNIKALVKSAYLKVKDETDVEYLTSSLSLIIRFWISEAAVSHSRLSVEAQIRHYLSMIAKLLSAYATAKGKKEIEGFVAGL
ncbi:MAG: TetR family transcriptional regulator [Lewinellaceae bacterium]|nr:TetR family transcriptional regulator [Lewinellaceae bacterium]